MRPLTPQLGRVCATERPPRSAPAVHAGAPASQSSPGCLCTGRLRAAAVAASRRRRRARRPCASTRNTQAARNRRRCLGIHTLAQNT
eukprot:6211432-Pleurochrysis_carterae.AAC.2